MRIQINHDVHDILTAQNAGAWIPLPIPVISQNGKATLVVQLELPLVDVQGYWQPHLSRPKMQLDWNIEFQASVNFGFPFLSFFNSKNQNCLSIGVSDPNSDIQMHADLDQTRHTYRIKIQIIVDAESVDLALWIDVSDRKWMQSLYDYVQRIRETAVDYPAASWRPVYCTWYARHRRINQSWVEQIADIASKIGFGTLILDDGWSCADSSTVSPATLPTWYAPIGQWQADPTKFPDFAAHIRRIRALGLNYMVWVAPLMVGIDTELGQRLSKERKSITGFVNIDPEREDEIASVMQAIEALLASAPLDGLKLDFLDEIRPSLEKPTGRSMRRLMERLSALIRRDNPNAMIEYRQNYTGPGTLKLATNFRALDVPYDFISNLHRISQIRLCLGDGVPVHADPAFWHPQETPLNIARHLIASMAGVPMISMDLATLPAYALKLIKHWLGVYNRYIQFFQQGHWEVYYDFDRVAAMTVTHGEQALALIYDVAGWRQIQATHLYQCVINGSDHELELGQQQLCADMFGHAIKSSILPAGGIMQASETPPMINHLSHEAIETFKITPMTH